MAPLNMQSGGVQPAPPRVTQCMVKRASTACRSSLPESGNPNSSISTIANTIWTPKINANNLEPESWYTAS
ncbi:hypothetical protein FIBSPDRAFT_880553 [Athelia psychrophila]|uniref:Uncharacterized protein n=1 Tax=Athelia psychrophila TaxID=1759441 RepID=A0A167SPV5_9AGAM|nr:hypothetical protein FIBSPDRAFT_880553 [Fibularhizoctonia sp. CBS 109695]